MRHTRFTQSYLPQSPSLEVTEAELCHLSVVPVKVRYLGMVRRSDSVADLHRVTIYRNVDRRMQVARAQGDQRLLRALEAELSEMLSI